MKAKLLVLLFAAMAFAATASAQQDPKDAGAADSLVLSFAHLPDLASGDSSVVVEIYMVNDLAIQSLSSGFQWNTSLLVLQSGEFSATATTAFNMFRFVYNKNNLDSSNATRKFQCSAGRISGNGMGPGRTLLATYNFHLTAAVDSIVIDSSKFNAMLYVTDVGNIEFAPRFSGALVYKLPQSVEVIDNGALPNKFDLAQNYPNPFNPQTTFEFALPQAASVELTVYNVLGQKVITLINQELAAGTYKETWSGTSESGSQVASGIYFYRLTAGDFVSTKKMMLLK